MSSTLSIKSRPVLVTSANRELTAVILEVPIADIVVGHTLALSFDLSTGGALHSAELYLRPPGLRAVDAWIDRPSGV